MTETLSAEFFYPDCPECSADGALNTMRNSRPAFPTDWECLTCGNTFDTPDDSVWNGVDDLDNDHRLAHVHANIRGIDVESVAPIIGVPAEEVAALAEEARDHVGKPTGD